MAAILKLLTSILSDALARIFKDWRRDKALEDAGAVKADAKHNAAVAHAERRAAAVPRKDEDAAISDLEQGKF